MCSQGEAQRRTAFLHHPPVPGPGQFKAFIIRQIGLPSQAQQRLVDVELEQAGFVERLVGDDFIAIGGVLEAPRRAERVRSIPGPWRSALRGPEVKGFSMQGRILVEPCAQSEITAQRLQHVLPRAAVARRAARILTDAPPHQARTQSATMRSAAQSPPPITLPARADASFTGPPALLEEGVEVGIEGEVRTALRTAVDILSTQPVGLAVSPRPFDVVVDLVAGDDHGDARPVDPSQGVQYRSPCRLRWC